MVLVLSLTACFEIELNPAPEELCESQDWFEDLDGDGYGSSLVAAPSELGSCETPAGAVDNSDDCDDTDALVFPGAVEICNDLDDDCNTLVDDEPVDPGTWYLDLDEDGFGDQESPVQACELPADAVSNDLDCDDGDPDILPGGTETCDGVDQDCDDLVDELAVDMTTWYLDGDSDGWGVPGDEILACEQPSGYADNPDDCDDTEPTLTEVCIADPAVSESNCSGRFYTWAEAEPSDPELNVISLYQADVGSEGSTGSVAVNIERETTMTLVLASYHSVDWTVTTAAGTTIKEILVTGYHAQSVIAPRGVSVSIRSFEQTMSNYGFWCGYTYPYTGDGCNTSKLISGVESESGLALNSFSGCYSATEFTLK